MCRTWRPFSDALALRPNKCLPPKPNSIQEHTGDATTLPTTPDLPTHPEEGNDDPDQIQDTEDTQLSGHNDLNIKFPPYHTEEGCKQESDLNADESDDDSLPDLLDSGNTLTDDEQDNYDTIGHTRPWDDHDHAQVQDEQETPELADAEISRTERSKRSRKKPTLLSFDFNSQDRKWTESRSQAKKALMKAYATEVVEPNNPKLGQGEDPAEYFPPPMNVMQMLRYKDGKKKTAWLKALKKELKTIIDSGTLNNRENPKPDDVVVSTTEANKIKLDQQGNVDKLKVRVCVRGDLQKKKDPTMEDPHSPAASMRMSKLLMAEAARHKARVFQLDVIGAFLQARMRSRVFITLPRVYGEIFPEFKAYCGRPVLLVKAMYGMTLSGKYWYEEFKEWLVSIGFNICPT